MPSYMSMVNHMSSGSKNVQTELGGREYARLREIAEEEGISIKEALRRATREWIDRHDAPAPDDPLFTFHDGYEVPTSGPTAAGRLDDELYGEPSGRGP